MSSHFIALYLHNKKDTLLFIEKKSCIKNKSIVKYITLICMNRISKSVKINLPVLDYIIEQYESFKFDDTYVTNNISTYNYPLDVLKSIYKYTNKKTSQYIETYSRNRNIGRMYSGKNGIQLIRKEIRNALFYNDYFDIDIVNSAPTILSQYCNKNKIKTKYIDDYVNNRDIILSNIVTHLQVDRDEAKRIIISIINGGSIPKNNTLNWIKEFHTEMDIILTAVFNLENEERIYQNNLHKKKQNIKGTVMSNILTTIENDILQHINSYMKTNFGQEIDVLIFDGGLVPKSVQSKVSANLKNISDYVYEKTNYRIKIIIKEMKQYITINLDNIKKNVNIDYENKKIEFEKKACRIDFPKVKYLLKDEIDNVHYSYTKDELKNQCINMRLSDGTCFIDKWIVDPTIRSYRKEELILPPNICASDIFNLWDGTAIEKKQAKNQVKYSDTAVKNVQLHLKYMCNNDNDCFQYLENWLAHLIQKPSEIPRVAIITKSEEGIGKNIFFDFITDIIGHEYSISVSDANESLFGDFNDIRENKLIINIDELKLKDAAKFNEKLKAAITNLTAIVNGKYAKRKMIKNYIRIWIFTNNYLPIRVTNSSRRYLMIECTLKPKSNEYYEQLTELFASVKYQFSYFYYLKNKDISKFNPVVIPKTDFFNKSVSQSRNTIHQFFQELESDDLSNYAFYDIKDEINVIRIGSDEMYKLYKKFIHHNHYSDQLTRNDFDSIVLNMKEVFRKIKSLNSTSSYCYVFTQKQLKNYLVREMLWEYAEKIDVYGNIIQEEKQNISRFSNVNDLLFDSDDEDSENKTVNIQTIKKYYFKGKLITPIIISDIDES